MPPPVPSPPPDRVPGTQALNQALGIVWELGYLIAVPAVLLGFGGAYVDKYFHTSPVFLLSGLFFAVVASSAGVYRMIRNLMPPEPPSPPSSAPPPPPAA